MKKLLIIPFIFLFSSLTSMAQVSVPGGGNGGGSGGTNPDAPCSQCPGNGNGGGMPGGGAGAGGGTGTDGCSQNIWCFIAATVVKESTKRLSIKEKRKEIKKQWVIEAYEQIEKKLQQLNFDKILKFLEENKEYFEEFYSKLKTANSSYQVWRKVSAIVEKQAAIETLYSRFGQMGNKVEYFKPEELKAFEVILNRLFEDSQENVDQLWLVVKTLKDDQMGDAERLVMIDAIQKRVDKNQTDIRELNEFFSYVYTQRRLNTMDSEQTKKLYSLE